MCHCAKAENDTWNGFSESKSVLHIDRFVLCPAKTAIGQWPSIVRG